MLAHPFWLFLNALIVVLLILDFLPLLLRKIPRAKKWISLLPEKILHLIGELGSYPFRKVMVPALFLSLVFNFVGVGLSNLVLFRALGGGVELFEYLSVIFLITIVSSIPISINNIGLKEWAYAVFFGYLGASVEAAVTVALVSRILQMFVSFASLPFYLRSRDLLGREQEGGRR
ncbi:MAG: flippase-like domain-containing protein [Candidatus Moraniibacteriota bacterium]|nr:MAG: flippase-like domain-containing protein [Candidatus Moranbacteria bacterium]